MALYNLTQVTLLPIEYMATANQYKEPEQYSWVPMSLFTVALLTRTRLRRSEYITIFGAVRLDLKARRPEG